MVHIYYAINVSDLFNEIVLRDWLINVLSTFIVLTEFPANYN